MESENCIKPPENSNFSVGNEDNVCRVCLKICLEKWDLFRNNDVLKKIMAFAAVQIEEGDGLPANVCLNCKHLVDMSYSFKLQVEKSDLTLRKTREEGAKFSELLPQLIQETGYDEFVLKTENSVQQSCDNNIKEKQSFVQDINQDIKFNEEQELNISERKHYETMFVNDLRIDENMPKTLEKENDESGNEEYVNDDLNYSYGSEFIKDEIKNIDIVEENVIDKQFLKREESEDERPLIDRSQRLKCSHCIKTFASKTALKKHLHIHEKNIACYLCEKRFPSLLKANIHIQEYHNVTPNKEKILEYSKNLEMNQKSDEESDALKDLSPEKKATKYICKICNKQFTYQKSFITHAKTHPEYKNEFPNDESPEDVLAETNSNSSHKSHDSEEEDMLGENIQCTQCGKLFATQRNLKRHLLTHSGLKHNCSMCGKDFSRLDKLREHEQCKHKEELYGRSDSEDDSSSEMSGIVKTKKEKNNRPHKCGLCPKAFAQPQSLANHIERHKRVRDVQKRFLCEVCSKCFAQSGSLVAHMRTHTGVRPYVCNVCTRAFTKSTYLQLHLRTHSGEKPYICQYCSRAFARANTLARHITMHTGEAKYHCQVCNKSFRRLTSLNEHTYTHTGQRPYACKICAKRYNNAGSLYAHTKKCKAQQSTMNSTNFQTTVDPVDNHVPQVMIYTPKKLINETMLDDHTEQDFLMANNQKQIPNTPMQTFTVEEQDVYSMNPKPFNTPYYGIYPSM